MDNFDREYDALRSEQRYRYEHINKLNSGFITFTTAVLTIGFGLFVMVSNAAGLNTGLMEQATELRVQVFELREQVAESQEQKDRLQKTIEIKQALIDDVEDEINKNKCIEVEIQLLQSIFFLLPILYSKICFNHSLENNVRISLISSYLEAANPDKNNWDSFRHKNRIRYFFGSFGIMEKNQKAGDLKNMHILISSLSAALGMIYGGGALFNCVPKDGMKKFFVIMLIGVSTSILFHSLIAFIFKKINDIKLDDNDCERKEYLIIINRHIKFIKIPKGAKEDAIERLFQNQKKINTILTWAFCIAEAVSLFHDKDIARYDMRIVLCAGIFIVFATFCIWQFPCYALECNIADWRIRQHDKKAKEQFANPDCE